VSPPFRDQKKKNVVRSLSLPRRRSFILACISFGAAMLALVQSQMGYMAPVPTLRTPASVVSPRMAVDDMMGTGPESLNKVFDPLGFTKYGSEKTLAWCRAALTRRGVQCGYPCRGELTV